MYDWEVTQPGVSPVPINSADELRNLVLDWREWVDEQALSWEELVDWLVLWEWAAGEFGLTEEFRENGII